MCYNIVYNTIFNTIMNTYHKLQTVLSYNRCVFCITRYDTKHDNIYTFVDDGSRNFCAGCYKTGLLNYSSNQNSCMEGFINRLIEIYEMHNIYRK